MPTKALMVYLGCFCVGVLLGKKRTTSGWWWNLRDLYLAYLKVQKGYIFQLASPSPSLPFKRKNRPRQGFLPTFPTLRGVWMAPGVRHTVSRTNSPVTCRMKVHPMVAVFFGGAKKRGSPNLDAQNIETATFTTFENGCKSISPRIGVFLQVILKWDFWTSLQTKGTPYCIHFNGGILPKLHCNGCVVAKIL